MRGLYGMGIALGWWLLRAAAALGNAKACSAVQGRQGWEERLKAAQSKAALSGKTGPWIHVHCASVGEYEQAAPVLDGLAARAPERPILLTFFSPSGREAVSHPAADHIDYLPWDRASTMRKWATLLNAGDAVLVKYELWPNLMWALHRHGTRLHLIAARFDRGRHPMNRWGAWVRKHLHLLTSLHVQDPVSQSVLAEHGLSATVSGDPRADRVLQVLDRPASPRVQAMLDRIRTWKGQRKLLLIGSAWPGEWTALELARNLWPETWAFLVVPHEIDAPFVDDWCSDSSVTRTSDHPGQDFPTSTGLVLDEMGGLRDAYRLADLAIVGGGWKAGVHNTLEPAAHGLPMAVGPEVSGFREIQGLQDVGALTVHGSPESMAQWVQQWMGRDHGVHRQEAGEAAQAWVKSHRGAADRIVLDLLKD